MIQPETGQLLGRRWPMTSSVNRVGAIPVGVVRDDDLFERTAPVYAFIREHLFRDDSDRIATALWENGAPPPGALMLEVGCGPGLYARRLAARFPGLRTVGVDRSWRLLALARERSERDQIVGSRFEPGDALSLDWPDRSVDAVVASRLLTVVESERAIAELHRVLKPGGCCFVAEPTSAATAAATLLALRLAAWLARSATASRAGDDAPRWPHRLGSERFREAVGSQPWDTLTVEQDHGYQYAVGVKAGGGAPRW